MQQHKPHALCHVQCGTAATRYNIILVMLWCKQQHINVVVALPLKQHAIGSLLFKAMPNHACAACSNEPPIAISLTPILRKVVIAIRAQWCMLCCCCCWGGSSAAVPTCLAEICKRMGRLTKSQAVNLFNWSVAYVLDALDQSLHLHGNARCCCSRGQNSHCAATMPLQ